MEVTTHTPIDLPLWLVKHHRYTTDIQGTEPALVSSAMLLEPCS
jgi:hypothetical protein